MKKQVLKVEVDSSKKENIVLINDIKRLKIENNKIISKLEHQLPILKKKIFL